MRKIILMMLMAVFSSSAMAEWVKVGARDSDTFYADPSSIRKAGDRVKMWDLTDSTMAATTTTGKPFMSIKTQNEYDCKEEQFRLIYISNHAENMGRGNLVSWNSKPGNWETIMHGNALELLWKFACGKP